MIPGVPLWAIKYGAIAMVVVALFVGGWFKGAAHVRASWDAERQANTLAAAEQAKHQAEATVEIVTKYVDRVQVVKGKTQTIIKEVPVYVPVQADSDCTINNGFVRLHDSAANNTPPGPPGPADAAPSTAKLSTVAETITGNYGACHENSAQLVGLQEWIRSMQGL